MTQPGNENAWRDLFDEYYPKVLRAVRRRLDRPMRLSCTPTQITDELLRRMMVEQPKITSRDEMHHYLIAQVELLVRKRSQAGE